MSTRKGGLGATVAFMALAAISLSGCSSTEVPTCAEYAALNLEYSNLSSGALSIDLNDAQRSALQTALRSREFDDGIVNVEMAATAVQWFCQISGGAAASNSTASISEALS